MKSPKNPERVQQIMSNVAPESTTIDTRRIILVRLLVFQQTNIKGEKKYSIFFLLTVSIIVVRPGKLVIRSLLIIMFWWFNGSQALMR